MVKENVSEKQKENMVPKADRTERLATGKRRVMTKQLFGIKLNRLKVKQSNYRPEQTLRVP
jgi:hypothetical protein